MTHTDLDLRERRAIEDMSNAKAFATPQIGPVSAVLSPELSFGGGKAMNPNIGLLPFRKN
jgi:hypothetical protein